MTGPREPAPRDANPPCQKRPDIFFPQRGNRLGYDEAAKHICDSGQAGDPCPYRSQCREWAVHRVVEGVWGGQDEGERKKEQRTRRIVPEMLSTANVNGVRRAYRRQADLKRPDYGALRKCDVCGQEMRPKSLPKHHRTMHEPRMNGAA